MKKQPAVRVAQKKTVGPNLSARIDPDLLKKAKHYMVDHDIALQALVEAALADYLRKRGVQVDELMKKKGAWRATPRRRGLGVGRRARGAPADGASGRPGPRMCHTRLTAPLAARGAEIGEGSHGHRHSGP